MLLTLPLLTLAPRLRLRHQPSPTHVFDPVRQRWVPLTPEEWVRQLLLLYLIQQCGYRPTLLAVERTLSVHGRTRRYDLVAHTPHGHPYLLVECKAPDITLNTDTFAQAAPTTYLYKPPTYSSPTDRQPIVCDVTPAAHGSYQFLSQLPPPPV